MYFLYFHHWKRNFFFFSTVIKHVINFHDIKHERFSYEKVMYFYVKRIIYVDACLIINLNKRDSLAEKCSLFDGLIL